MDGESSRIVGIDVARGFAILGMVVAHAFPRADESELIVDGRSSILFATLAGVSLGIMTGATRPFPQGSRADRVLNILMRALVLFVMGVVLSTLGSEIAIILDYYGILFVMLVPMLFLPRIALVAIATGLLIVAPPLARLAADAGPLPDATLAVVQYYFLTGYYPVLVWIPFLIAGLIAARSGLERPTTQFWMIAAGGFAAILGYGAAQLLPGVTAKAHSGSLAEVVGSGGLAIAIIGALLWLTAPERRGLGRSARAVFWPVSAIGSMALTIYVAQIVTLALVASVEDGSPGAIAYPGWPLLAGLVLGSMVVALLWRRFLGKGPLERAMSTLSRRPQPRAKLESRS